MLRRRRPVLDVHDATRAGVAAIWAAGGWPTATRVAQLLRRAEDGDARRLTDIPWPGGTEQPPTALVAALDRLVRSGELDVVGAPDDSEIRFRPSRALVEEWLPLVKGRELRRLEGEIDPASTPAGTRLAAAGGAARGALPSEPIDDDALVDLELQLRARRLRLLVETRPGAARSLHLQLEEEASLRAQTGQLPLARQQWSELGSLRLDPSNGLGQPGVHGLLALEEAVLSGDAQLQTRVLARTISEDGLTGPGRAWQRTLRGLVLDEAVAVHEGAAELDGLDGRKRKETADVALGAASRALVAGDRDAFQAALERTIAQHLRYLRNGSWRGDASPCRAAMVLRVLGAQRGLGLPDELFLGRVTVQLRCCDVWQGEPVHRHRARGTVDLAPLCRV